MEPIKLEEFYPSGLTKSITRFINNKKQGMATEYDEKGNIKCMSYYKDDGSYTKTFFKKNKRVRLELNYQDGVKHGHQMRGKYRFIYKNGLKHGIQKGKEEQYFLQGVRCSKEVYEKLKDTDTVPPLPIPKKETIIINCVVTDQNGIETYVKKELNILRKFDSKRNLLKEIRFLGMTKDEYGCATVRNLHGEQIEFTSSGELLKVGVYNNNKPCGEHYTYFKEGKRVEFYEEIFGMKLTATLNDHFYVFYRNLKHGIWKDNNNNLSYYYLDKLCNKAKYDKLIINKLVHENDIVFFHYNGVVQSIQNKNIFVKYDDTGKVTYISYLQNGVPHGLTRDQDQDLYYYQGRYCLSKKDFLNGKYIDEKTENIIFQAKLFITKIIIGVEVNEEYTIPGIQRFDRYYGYEVISCNNIEGKIITLRNIFNKEPNFYLV